MPIIRELIIPMTLNSSGIRDTARVLKISTNTVIKVIREEAKKCKEIKIWKRMNEVEMDEQWSYIRKKTNKCWLWIALERRRRKVVGYVLGKRGDKSCKELIDLFGK